MELAMKNRRGLLIVLSSPSGAGKSSISRQLMADDSNITMSISATTRAPRPGEVDGKHYHFVTDEEFDRMVDEDEFAEWAYVFDHRYGSPKEPIKEALRQGKDILFDIDWQGTQALVYAFGHELVPIFILPPSMEELEKRLRGRNTDSDAVIEGRMHRAEREIGHWFSYDYVLVNDDFTQCLDEVKKIIEAERLKKIRRPDLPQFVRKLVERPND
ncbi:guanylate kinase [Sphingomicrobium aestuariivivum]|uniref:guanylate kinase n=1 Tax=Sphingomicrobium aestuariivivum TaxID=1582356 RepID=UPI001FD6907F|nr:guanylate kinase [Sphingomicrobium aestuariivivum]MCJ8191520.1 guanylate kinase [Sphingomicrobium aestuariivivum]